MRKASWMVIVMGFLVSATALAAHSADQPIPLINWTAPPYWVPQSERTLSPATKRIEAPATVTPPSLAFHSVAPCRIADTRGNGFAGAYGPPSLLSGFSRSFVVTSPSTSCGIPSTAVAVSFNFAVVNMSAGGNLVAHATGTAVPTVSSLNWVPSEGAISNAAVIPLSAGGSIDVLVNGALGSTTDLVIDVNGYYAADAQTLYYAVLSSLSTSTFAMGPVSWIDSINLGPTGHMTLSINPSTFAKYPLCHCNPLESGSQWWCVATPHGAPDPNGNFPRGQWTTLNYKIDIDSGNTAAVDLALMLTCYAQN